MRSQRVKALLAHPRFNVQESRTACARWSARSRSATSRASTRPTAPATRSPPTRCWRSIRANPQLASALAGAFNLWKRFPEPRRGAMERALVRVARTPGLSPDVREVVTRTLED